MSKDDMDRSERVRAFAGLAVGTRWWDNQNDREIIVDRARDTTTEGIDHVSLEFTPAGTIDAEQMFTLVKAGQYEPNCPDADSAFVFANRSVDTEINQ